MDKEKKKQRLSTLIIDGGEYLTTFSEKYKNKKPYRENNPDLVRAFLPGTIVEILTKPGKKVQEGEVLVILEAMKMRNSIVAPHDGNVKKIFVNLGQLVSKNFVMVEMD